MLAVSWEEHDGTAQDIQHRIQAPVAQEYLGGGDGAEALFGGLALRYQYAACAWSYGAPWPRYQPTVAHAGIIRRMFGNSYIINRVVLNGGIF